MIVPIIVTILGFAYIISPLDFLPEIVLGPIGLVDDALVLAIIGVTWLFYIGSVILSTLLPLILVIGGVIGLIFLLNFLNENPKRRKK